MIGDPREAIMQRLLAIAETLAVVAVRNVKALPDDALPAISVLEGDEAGDPQDAPTAGQPNRRFSRIVMTPEIVIKVANAPETVGSDLNALRQLVIKAVLTDADLATLTTNAGRVQYAGAGSALAYGRSMVGEAALSFAITYLLRPDLL